MPIEESIHFNELRVVREEEGGGGGGGGGGREIHAQENVEKSVKDNRKNQQQ